MLFKGGKFKPNATRRRCYKFDVINVKTSAKGNQYTNIQNVSVVPNPNDQQHEPQYVHPQYTPTQAPQSPAQTMPVPQANNSYTPKPPNGGMNKSDTQRLDIFVTGVVGRSMGSGHFSVNDIEDLTKNAVRAFDENLKKL